MTSTHPTIRLMAGESINLTTGVVTRSAARPSDHPAPTPGRIDYRRRTPRTRRATPATAFVVVVDGHTAAEGTWTVGSFDTRGAAIEACDESNRVSAERGAAFRFHVERV